tara:strand:+ start:18 stop:500 length:483 start_codon:yes stop_codon:yes gene_type:complete
MNSYKFDDSIQENSSNQFVNLKEQDKFSKVSYIKSDKIVIDGKSLLLKLIHRILNSINLSLFGLILILSFISLDSQNKWSRFYDSLIDIRVINNNLIDYISKTEEFYLENIDLKNNIKKTTSKDLIYLFKKQNIKNNNFLLSSFKNIMEGVKDSQYQRGY